MAEQQVSGPEAKQIILDNLDAPTRLRLRERGAA